MPALFRRPLPWWLKPALHLLAAATLARLAFGWAELLWFAPGSLRLSAEPVAHTHNALGLAALRLLVASLAVTPLRRITGWGAIQGVRRMLGLWAFAYALLHLGFYLVMDLDGSVVRLLAEAAEKPFILFGLAALLAMAPLAATSSNGAIRALGARRWLRLHRLAYVAGLAGAVHYLFRVKGFQPDPWLYAGLLLLLLALRFRPSSGSASP